MKNTKYLTVTDITKYLKYKFDSDNNLQTVCIKGEISNFKNHASGLYFSLKDENAVINASMFKSYIHKLNFKPTDGSKVLVIGRISIYPKSGRYQITVTEMILDGIGNLFLAFEKLKNDLYKEGLFNKEHKLKIPKFPKKVGVITAPTGAAVKDIISTIKRRCPITEVILFPSLVQGDMAAKDIVRNIKLASNYDLDVLIIGRGGGSIEDLWPFNEEIVARAIYDCKIPIISGTGHEPDITITDYVCDHRASTPTGAAEVAVPLLTDLISYIEQSKSRLNASILNKLKKEKLKINNLKTSYVIKTPELIYENKLQQIDLIKVRLDELLYLKLERSTIYYKNILSKINYVNPLNQFTIKSNKLNNISKNINIIMNLKIKNIRNYNISIHQKIDLLNPINSIYNYEKEIKNETINVNKMMLNILNKKEGLFINITNKLELLNPLTILKRGYSITYINDKVVNDINKVNINDNITIKMDNGNILAKITDIKGE